MSRSIETVKALVKRLQADFTWIRENFASLDDQDYINYNNFIANTLKRTSKAIYDLDGQNSNYCKIVLNQYVAYIRESLEDYGWLFSENEKPSVDSMKKIFKRIFASEHSARNTPFVNTIETTLESFNRFCNAIYLDANGIFSADTVEILLHAIKMQDTSKMKAIVAKDRTLLTRVYSLNNSIDELGFTPLMYAAKYGHADIIRDGLFFILKGKKEISIYLSNKIKDENSQFQSYNLLMIAARWGKSDTFAYFLQTMTPRAVMVMLEPLFSALVTPYASNAEANKTFKKIYAIFKEGDSSARLERVLKDFIFSDNVNLVAKINCLHARIVGLHSPVLVNDAAPESKEEAAPNHNRQRLFSASAGSNDANIDAGPRYPSRKRLCRGSG
jgi:hypothetical protein